MNKFRNFVDRQLKTNDDFESFFSILKKALLLFKNQFFRIFAFYFLLLVIPNILGFFIQRSLSIVGANTVSPFYFSLVVLFFVLFSLFVSLLSLVINFGSCYLIHSLDEGRNESFLQILKHILSRKKTIIVSILLSPIVLFGGLSAFLLPFVFLVLGMMFLTHGVMLENKNFSDAFVQSFWYSKNKRWFIFLKLILLLLFCIFFSNAIFSFLALIFALVPEVYQNSLVFLSLSKIVEYGISSIFWSFIVTFVYFLWKSAKNATVENCDNAFKKKYKKILKIFGVLGLVAIILIITILIIFTPVLE